MRDSRASAGLPAGFANIRCSRLRLLRRQPGRKQMKLVRYGLRHEPAALARLGLMVTPEVIADLRAGYALYLVEEVDNPKGRDVAGIYMPPYISQFLHVGEPA